MKAKPAVKAKPKLVTPQDYRTRYQDALKERGVLEYFDRHDKPNTWMLPFNGELAPG